MAHLSGLPDTEGLRRAHEIADFCDLGEERYREVESYSTGMRQKLKFAQALVHDPPLLILDEPTTGLDPGQRESMLRRIRSLSGRYGKSVILSTHILPDVRQVCDQVVMLVRGTVRIVDTLENLSRPAEPTLHVAVHGESDAFRRRLVENRFSVAIDSDGTLRIGGVEDSAIARVWSVAAETGTSIRRLQPAQNSLDKIFFEAASGAICREQGHAAS
jgi:ABC-2 type transport system ATP-binding protein